MPQSALQPGQQANPNAIKAMPVTHATEMAAPVNSSPKSNRPMIDGTTSNVTPVAISVTEVTNRIIRVWRFMPSLSRGLLVQQPTYIFLPCTARFLITFGSPMQHGHFGTAGIDSPASFTGGLSEPDKKPVI